MGCCWQVAVNNGLNVVVNFQNMFEWFLFSWRLQYGRYFVEQYEIKIFAGVFGICVGVVDAFKALVLYKNPNWFLFKKEKNI